MLFLCTPTARYSGHVFILSRGSLQFSSLLSSHIVTGCFLLPHILSFRHKRPLSSSGSSQSTAGEVTLFLSLSLFFFFVPPSLCFTPFHPHRHPQSIYCDYFRIVMLVGPPHWSKRKCLNNFYASFPLVKNPT